MAIVTQKAVPGSTGEAGRKRAAPVRRAMLNLRSVLQHRLGGGIDKDKLHEVVALIDEAASKIERL